MVAEHEPPAEDTPAEQTMVIHDVRLEQKFTQVPYEVVFMRGLSRDAKHTYTVLLSYAWKHNRCFPGMVRLCEDLGASEPVARRFLRELQAYRLIRIERRGLQRTNLYHFLPVADAGDPPLLTVVPPRPMSPERNAGHAQDRKARFTPTKDEVDTEGSIPRESNTTANAVGADAPPPAQKQTRATKAPKPKRDDPAAVDTADLPYRLSEEILLAADRPATRGSVLKIIRAVKTEVIDAYRGQGVMFTDAKACLAYMQTHPDYAGLKAKWITWEALAKELGPWLKAGKPAQYVEPVRAKPPAAPPRFVPSMIPQRPLTKEAQEWEALVKARDAKRAAEAQATGGVP
jgi:hypothetical protein